MTFRSCSAGISTYSDCCTGTHRMFSSFSWQLASCTSLALALTMPRMAKRTNTPCTWHRSGRVGTVSGFVHAFSARSRLESRIILTF